MLYRACTKDVHFLFVQIPLVDSYRYPPPTLHSKNATLTFLWWIFQVIAAMFVRMHLMVMNLAMEGKLSPKSTMTT